MKTPIIEGLNQNVVDSYLASRQYSALYWPTLFPLQDVNSLDAKTLIGAEGSRVAAHVIAYNASAPRAGRKAIATKYFDIPKIAQARVKDEKDILEHRIARSLRGNDAVIEDYFNDIDFTYDSCQARMEWNALQAISLMKLQYTTANNPQGLVQETVVDFGLPTANKQTVAVVWSGNPTTMTPIADFKKVVKAARDKGITFERILMHPDAFDLITGSTEFQNACKSLLIGESVILGMMGLDTVNKVLNSLRLPPITLIETSVGIEGKDGTITQVNPFSSTHVTFIPSTIVGKMYNGPIAAEIEKPLDVLQSKRSNVLIQIKKNFDPISVVTLAECNAFPSFPMIDRCFSLYLSHTSTWA
jgi:hypothetical protein